MAEPFSGWSFGLGIALGFLAACLLVWAFVRLRNAAEPKLNSRATWEVVDVSRPMGVVVHTSTPAKPGPQESRRMDVETMAGANKTGPLQTALQSMPTPSRAGLPVGSNDVVVTVAASNVPAPAPAPVPTINNTAPPAPSLETPSAGHKRVVSTASVYDVDNLDDDWVALLQHVDAKLTTAGHPVMTTNEQNMAVRKLVAVTATRGIEGAVTAAVEEILRFRSWNPQPR